eukprot:380875_1
MTTQVVIIIELIEPIPTGHDRITNGYQYFTVSKGHGIHLQITNIIKTLNVDDILMKLKDILCFLNISVPPQPNQSPPSKIFTTHMSTSIIMRPISNHNPSSTNASTSSSHSESPHNHNEKHKHKHKRSKSDNYTQKKK